MQHSGSSAADEAEGSQEGADSGGTKVFFLSTLKSYILAHHFSKNSTEAK